MNTQTYNFAKETGLNTVEDLKQRLFIEMIKMNDKSFCYWIIKEFVINEGYKQFKNKKLCKKGQERYNQVLKELNWEDSETYHKRTDEYKGYDF